MGAPIADSEAAHAAWQFPCNGAQKTRFWLRLAAAINTAHAKRGSPGPMDFQIFPQLADLRAMFTALGEIPGQAKDQGDGPSRGKRPKNVPDP